MSAQIYLLLYSQHILFCSMEIVVRKWLRHEIEGE